jgi:Tfp pilus assembly protein PilO
MNEKQFTIIWVVALVIILLAGGGAIWYLQFNILVEKKQELDGVKEQVRAATAKKNKIPELLTSIKELEKKEAELIQHIPNLDRSEYDVFAELLDEFRRKAGVTVPRVTWTVPSRAAPVPGKLAQPATVHKVQYDLSVTGSFYQVLRYINIVEQHKRFIGIESFNIAKAGGDPVPGTKATSAPKRDLKIIIYSYTYKLPPQPYVIDAEEARSGHSTEIPD